jgi:hypothetical protein
VLKTADWNSAKSAIQARQELTKAFQQARCLRDQFEKDILGKREDERVVETVFGQFAESMNKMELWTGKEQTSPNLYSLADKVETIDLRLRWSPLTRGTVPGRVVSLGARRQWDIDEPTNALGIIQLAVTLASRCDSEQTALAQYVHAARIG